MSDAPEETRSTWDSERLRRNAESKSWAINDGSTWSESDLEWLRGWDRTEELLPDLAMILGRTLEACREMYYLRNRLDDWSVFDGTFRAPNRPERAACPICHLVHGTSQEEC